jgi:hypothetical protein
MEKSDVHTVVMRSVSLETSGRYRCEVSADAPTFHTAMVARWMHVVGECTHKGGGALPLAPLAQSHFHAPLIALGKQTSSFCLSNDDDDSSSRNNQPLLVLWAASWRRCFDSVINCDLTTARFKGAPSLLARLNIFLMEIQRKLKTLVKQK